MKHRLHHLALAAALMLGSLTHAQSTGDVFFQTRPATPGPLEPGWLSKGNTKVIMFDATGHLVPIAIGGNLSLNAGVLDATGATIADGSITNAKIASNAAIALSKLATDPLARANHTGTQSWSTITGTPTTRDGYGLTDVLTTTELSSTYAGLASPTFTGVVNVGARLVSSGDTYSTTIESNDAAEIQFRNLVTPGTGKLRAPAFATDDDLLWTLPSQSGTLARMDDLSAAITALNLGTASTLASGDINTGTVANGNVVTYTDYNSRPGTIFAKSAMWMYSDPIGGSSYWQIYDTGGELKFAAGGGSWELAINGSLLTADRVVSTQDKDGALALLTNHLGEFASTTSAQLLGKITDESGTGVVLTTNGSGAALTALNASNISSGSLPIARITDASVTNAKLANSAVTIGSTSVSLGSTATTLAGLTSVTSTTFVGALTGNASTATTATTASTVTTNANLTGAVTSSGNATSLGSFTKAALNTAVNDDDVAVISGNSFTGANTVTVGTNSATPVTASTLQNTTAAISGTQSASPGLVLEGRGWKTTATAASQAVSWKQYVLPVQGTTTPTSEWRLLSNTNGSDSAQPAIRAISNGPVVITGVSGNTSVLRLNHPDSYMGTAAEFTLGGSGNVTLCTLQTFPDTTGTRIIEPGNSANYVQLSANGTEQKISSSSNNLRFGTPAASPTSMTLTGAGARVGTDTNTSVTNALNVAGPNGTGTGTGGTLDLGYIASTTTGTAVGAFTSRIALKGGGEIIFSTKTAPSSASDTGTAGEVRIAGGYLYYCSATNTWLRAALTTW